jgi:hypothetical protein
MLSPLASTHKAHTKRQQHSAQWAPPSAPPLDEWFAQSAIDIFATNAAPDVLADRTPLHTLARSHAKSSRFHSGPPPCS